MTTIPVGQHGPFGMGENEYCSQIWQSLLDSRTGATPLQVASSGGTPVNGLVGQVGPFGAGYVDYLKQIWQIVVDSRSGVAPLIVTSV